VTEPLPAPLRVLLVEDNPDDAELIVRALREAGLEIDARVVATEAELLAALPAFVPEVVLSDWRLPGFSGEAAVAAAHAADPAVPVILISGTVGEDLVVKALHSGATDYVLKSRLEALVPAVRRALAEGAASREQIRLQAELEASQAAMRGSLDAMSDPFIICAAERDAAGTSVDFRVVFANRAAAAFMGRPPEPPVGAQTMHQLLYLRGVRFFDAFREFVAAGHGWADDSVEFSVTGPDGSTRRGLVDIQVARFGDGFFAVWRDVTERDRVRNEREQLAAALEQASDGVVIVKAGSSIVTYANPAFLVAQGMAHDDIVSQPRCSRCRRSGRMASRTC
jgi:CheY-like chemotaxis protein